MIGVIDYGAGNLQSVANALTHLGAAFSVCSDRGDLDAADKLLLPGVGHFGAACASLNERDMRTILADRIESDVPTLGICLGMQLLFARSEEDADAFGLGVLPGRVTELRAARVPHMGWNAVAIARACPWLPRAAGGPYYFAHGYVAADVDSGDLVGTVEIDTAAHPAIVGRGSLWGVQFHPEKSGEVGLELLERFARC